MPYMPILNFALRCILLEGTVSVISSFPPCKDEIADSQFGTLELLSGQ